MNILFTNYKLHVIRKDNIISRIQNFFFKVVSTRLEAGDSSLAK